LIDGRVLFLSGIELGRTTCSYYPLRIHSPLLSYRILSFPLLSSRFLSSPFLSSPLLVARCVSLGGRTSHNLILHGCPPVFISNLSKEDHSSCVAESSVEAPWKQRGGLLHGAVVAKSLDEIRPWRLSGLAMGRSPTAAGLRIQMHVCIMLLLHIFPPLHLPKELVHCSMNDCTGVTAGKIRLNAILPTLHGLA